MRWRWLFCTRVVVSIVLVFICFASLPLLKQLMVQHRPPTTHHTPLTQIQIERFIRDAQTANAERLLQVQNVCRKYNLGLYRDTSAPPAFKHPPTPQYSVFYIDLSHKVAWCPVYKAASTTWLYNLCLLGGYRESQLDNRTQQLSVLARKVFPELDYPQAEEALQRSLKLLVVRHPFERILSAYRDKLENTRVGGEHGTAHFYRKYGAHIVAKYRPGGNQSDTLSQLRPGSYFWPPDRPQPAGIEPTFKEFVKYLIRTDLLNYADDHWIPTYLFCTPCLLRYDIIAKVETMKVDQIYILRAASIDNIVQPRWQHRTVPEGKSTQEIASIYFSQLSPTEVYELYKKYQLDFELFGYEYKSYLKYTSNNK